MTERIRGAHAVGAKLALHWTDEAPDRSLQAPDTAEQAVALLDSGSAGFARLGSQSLDLWLDPAALGFGPEESDGVLTQQPFAAVLSCSDARVPIELTLGQAANELFVVRVAGNAPGSECRGSLHYAAQNLPSVKVFAVVGHSRCGATTAAVDATLRPDEYLKIATDGPLREIVDSLLAGVNFARRALVHVHGEQVTDSPDFHPRLVTLATLANTALSALVLERDLQRPCAFGVYKLSTREIGVRRADGWHAGFAMAPKSDVELTDLVVGAARSLVVR